MSPIEDKVRRRLAPFVAEGKIRAPQFALEIERAASPLTVNVRLLPTRARTSEVETALRAAIHDLGNEAQLVISPA